jgi:uncharacterized RDD family membrane protein YckC
MLPRAREAAMQYGRVSQRVLAFFVDAMILVLLVGIAEALGLPVFDDFQIVELPADGTANPETLVIPSIAGIVVTIALVWGYYVGFEVSRYEATPGKIALALRVTDLEGRRIGILRATVRHFAKILTAATLSFGFFMAIFTRRRQTLHDLIAGCLVLSKTK